MSGDGGRDGGLEIAALYVIVGVSGSSTVFGLVVVAHISNLLAL